MVFGHGAKRLPDARTRPGGHLRLIGGPAMPVEWFSLCPPRSTQVCDLHLRIGERNGARTVRCDESMEFALLAASLGGDVGVSSGSAV
jgi:hypothetical protein